MNVSDVNTKIKLRNRKGDMGSIVSSTAGTKDQLTNVGTWLRESTLPHSRIYIYIYIYAIIRQWCC